MPATHYAEVNIPLLLLKIILLVSSVVFHVGRLDFASKSDKPFMRRLGECVARVATDTLCYSEIQFICGRPLYIYKKWARRERQPINIDDLGEGAMLVWLGPKPDKLRNVILHFPGGGYVNPLEPGNLNFIRRAQLHIGERVEIEVGVAVLLYKLRPEGRFPTQLRDAKLALDFLLSQDVQPGNIQLTGDSSGAHLIIQLLSHMMHPLPPMYIDPIPPMKFRSIVLFSPWVSLRGDVGSDAFLRNDLHDTISAATYCSWGREYMAEVPPNLEAFGDPVAAPLGWFSDLDKLADRVLITAGEKECLVDAIVFLYERHLKDSHPDIQLWVQEDGLHVDFVLDFIFTPYHVTRMTHTIFEFLAEGININ